MKNYSAKFKNFAFSIVIFNFYFYILHYFPFGQIPAAFGYIFVSG